MFSFQKPVVQEPKRPETPIEEPEEEELEAEVEPEPEAVEPEVVEPDVVEEVNKFLKQSDFLRIPGAIRIQFGNGILLLRKFCKCEAEGQEFVMFLRFSFLAPQYPRKNKITLEKIFEQ